MYEYVKTWLALKTDERAVTALEYGLIAAVLAGVVLVGFTTFGNDLGSRFSNIGAKLT